MKIEINAIRKMLDAAREESRKPDNGDNLDQMFNFGVDRLFYKVCSKLFDAEELVREVEA